MPYEVSLYFYSSNRTTLSSVEIRLPQSGSGEDAATVACDAERKVLTDRFGEPAYTGKSAVSERYSWGEWKRTGNTMVDLTRVGGPHPACVLSFR
jgi:hypothetical protein